MVRIASSFIGAAVAFSSYAAAAPAVRKRQDIVPIDIAAAGGEGGLNTVDPNAIPTGVDINGSLGGSVEFPTPTPVELPGTPLETTTFETMPPVFETMPPVFETAPPSVHTSVVFPQYGSGGVSWHAGYNDCVQTCFASHPMPATVVVVPPQHEGSSVEIPSGSVEVPSGSGEGQVSSGNGSEHVIMVEPSAGSSRFVPAFVNAAVGDTIRFSVINGQHSITQSSGISPCNATANGFDSGVKIAGGEFVFSVTSTDPTFFFSNVGADCASGLFGAINAATGLEDSTTTVNSILPQAAESDADIKAALEATNALAASTQGVSWGGKIEMANIAPEFQTQMLNNILFTRSVMGNNPEMIDTNGNFNPTSEVVIPADRATVLAVANAGGYPAAQDVLNAPPAEDTVNAPAAAENLATPSDAPAEDGAGSIISSSRVLVAGFAVAAAMFFL